jgi:hypothetical protein
MKQNAETAKQLHFQLVYKFVFEFKQGTSRCEVCNETLSVCHVKRTAKRKLVIATFYK